MTGAGHSVGHRDPDQPQRRFLFLVSAMNKREILVISLLWIGILSLIDFGSGTTIALTPLLSVAPIVAAMALDPLETAGVATLAVLMTIPIGIGDRDLGTVNHEISTSVVVVIGLLAIWISYLRVCLRESLDIADARATHDALTGALNRRALLSRSEQLAAIRPDYRPPISFMMIDVDHFKRVNDSYGHLIGDEVLMEVSQRLAGAFRSGDSFGRYGGDEFLALLVGSERSGADVVAERTLTLMREMPIETSVGPIAVSVSIGISSLAPTELEVDSAVHRADTALYHSKRNGRAQSTVR